MRCSITNLRFGTLKFLLVIPVLAVLLSNVPVQVEITLPVTGPASDCGTMEEMMCFMPEEAANEDAEDEGGCCREKESRCTVTCCYQLAAPVLQLDKFRFGISPDTTTTAVYIEQAWTNPYISGPLRPPDHG